MWRIGEQRRSVERLSHYINNELPPAVEWIGISGKFCRRAIAHGDGLGDTFLGADRATDAIFGMRDDFVAFLDEAEIRAAGAVAALDAEIFVDLRDALDGRQIHEIGEGIFAAADEFGDGVDAAFGHVVGEAGAEVFNDVDAVFHGDGAELDVDRAESQEIGRIFVVHGAAVAADRDAAVADAPQRVVGNGRDAMA